MFDYIYCDLETDGIEPKIIWMVGVMTPDGLFLDFNRPDDTVVDGILLLDEAPVIMGWNFVDYDARVIRKLSGVDIPTRKIIDLMQLAKRIFPNLPSYKLRDFGEILGFPKGDHDDWTQYSAEMSKYCERDCRICLEFWNFVCETYPDIAEEQLMRAMGQ